MVPPGREGLERWAALGAVAVAFVGAMLDLPRSESGAIVGLGCERPVNVDGRLVCNDEPLQPSCADDREIEVGDTWATQAGCLTPVGRMPPDELQALAAAVDVNRASTDDLTSLPGVGPATAVRIVAGRPYADADGLLRVKGIGPKRLATFRARVAIEPVLR